MFFVLSEEAIEMIIDFLLRVVLRVERLDAGLLSSIFCYSGIADADEKINCVFGVCFQRLRNYAVFLATSRPRDLALEHKARSPHPRIPASQLMATSIAVAAEED